MFSIGDLSRLTGVKIPTIRYYEQMGLIAAPERSEGNQRRYTRQELDRLSFIRHARQLGLPIEDIRELAVLSGNPEEPCADAHSIALRHLASTRSRLEKLRRLERELTRMTAGPDACQAGQCRIIQSLADHGLCRDEH